MFPKPPHNEKELLSRIAAGDEYAFSELFDHYRPNVYTTALSMTGREWQAEEILQDTFLKVWLKRESLGEILNFGGWLYTIAERLTLNAILFHNRLQEKSREYAYIEKNGEAGDPDLILMEKQYEQALREAIDRLPEKQRQAYHFIKVLGMKREEAAKRLRVSPETIKSNLDQALKNIRAFCLARIEFCLFYWSVAGCLTFFLEAVPPISISGCHMI